MVHLGALRQFSITIDRPGITFLREQNLFLVKNRE